MVNKKGNSMNFNESDVLWIFKAITDRDRYCITVDNDCVSIDERVDDEWESVYVFNNYGQDLIVQLFNYIGCNADLV